LATVGFRSCDRSATTPGGLLSRHDRNWRGRDWSYKRV
jgi:hypothetical protein